METKDIIVMVVPIVCNGLVLFFLEKWFHKKSIVLQAKYHYVNAFKEKIDNTLDVLIEVLRSSNSDEQIDKVNEFFAKCADLIYYYDRNDKMLDKLEKNMKSCRSAYESISLNPEAANDLRKVEETIRNIDKELKAMQQKCVEYKV